jgi:hypothetical protein
MCRSIVTLRTEMPATDEEIRAAALQFIRKVSGQRAPSRANEAVFEEAVTSVAGAVRHLLDHWVMAPGARLPSTPASRLAHRA